MIETKQYSDGTSATGMAPLPDQSPAQQADWQRILKRLHAAKDFDEMAAIVTEENSKRRLEAELRKADKAGNA